MQNNQVKAAAIMQCESVYLCSSAGAHEPLCPLDLAMQGHAHAVMHGRATFHHQRPTHLLLQLLPLQLTPVQL